MDDSDKNLLDFFSANYKPGLIGLVGTKDAIGLAIREAQSLVSSDRKPSLWSHCFILGDLRLDIRGSGVRDCYKQAGRDFLAKEISVSNTTPEDIARAGVNARVIKINRKS